jgi:uncharacterized protein YbjT (DUF2867 family)
VFGASGYVGSNLVPRLGREALRVRAAAHSIKVLEARGGTGAIARRAEAGTHG